MNSKPYSVVLIRHAQSQWNLENRFSGWANPDLTEEGRSEAEDAANILKKNGYEFDLAYCSRLQRSKHTMDIILNILQQTDIEQVSDWRLNERHYGQLQGKYKDADANNTTEEQIWRWRRSYLDKADPLDKDDERHPVNNDLYSDVPDERLPAVENLKDTRIRVTEFWQDVIEPQMQEKKRILISSHGNTLRALIMELAQMEVEEVEGFEIPTGKPIIVTYDANGSFSDWRYLED